MKKVLAIGIMALTVAVAGLFVVGAVFAQEPDTTAEKSQTPWFWQRGWHGIQALGGIVSDAVADLLGMTPEEILAGQINGKTLEEMADEKGITEEEISNAVYAAIQERLDQAVSDNLITEEQAEQFLSNLEERIAGPRPGDRDGQPGRPEGRVSGFGMAPAAKGTITDSIATLLGMTPEEIREERAAGKTLSEIAAEHDISEQELVDAIIADQKDAIDQALEDGLITEAQADWLLEKAEATAPFTLSNPFTPGEDGWGGMRGGRMTFHR